MNLQAPFENEFIQLSSYVLPIKRTGFTFRYQILQSWDALMI